MGRRLPLAWAVLCCGSALAFEATVLDPQGKPIAGARACYVVGTVELLCSESNDAGWINLPDSQQDTLRIVADGFLPRTIAASAAVASITLELAPSLRVRLLDAITGKPLGQGEVSVIYPSGHAQGPFPVNAAGVRVRRVLQPGDVRIVAAVPGYVQDAAQPVRLEAGKETEVVIELHPAPPQPPGAD